MLQAKIKKEKIIKEQEYEMRAAENRRALTSDAWDFKRTEGYFRYRMGPLFKGEFKIDESNKIFFDLLCMYFSDDKDFVSTAVSLDISNPSLEKGILLAGSYGTGKTWLMKLMQKNKKNCYILKNAKEIANEFETDGQEAIHQYISKGRNAVNDVSFFYQEYYGLCIDDLGTENIKNNYGNRKNVVGDLFELRYDAGNTGKFLHATTNLSADGLTTFYGQRVVSRMRQIFNVIEITGSDRRK